MTTPSTPVLRLVACGSDDGRSALIGRLLGAEPEQDSTTGVVYRHLDLPSGRRAIIAEAPGHERYTRDMAVATSTADVALLLVDATGGIRDQTRRHLAVCAPMGVRTVVAAVDAHDLDHVLFERFAGEVRTAAARFDLDDVEVVPVSALGGDNVASPSPNTPWYRGPTVLGALSSWEPPPAGNSVVPHAYAVDRAARTRLKSQRSMVLWLTGMPGAGKSTIADALERRLHAMGLHTYVLDGDNVRGGLNKDLGFTPEHRTENVRRVAEMARLMLDAGLVVIVALVSPFRADRLVARNLFEPGDFAEVWVDTPVEVCAERDPKGLYAKARAGALPNMTGVDQNYEPPDEPDLVVNGSGSLEETVTRLTHLVADHP